MREITVLRYLLSGDKQDLVPGLLNPFFSAADLDLVAGVIWAGDLHFGCSFELQVLQLLTLLSNDKTVVLLGDGNCCRSLQQKNQASVKSLAFTGRSTGTEPGKAR